MNSVCGGELFLNRFKSIQCLVSCKNFSVCQIKSIESFSIRRVFVESIIKFPIRKIELGFGLSSSFLSNECWKGEMKFSLRRPQNIIDTNVHLKHARICFNGIHNEFLIKQFPDRHTKLKL